ncbi:molybdopterin binding oxidoreductase [Aaosphaeria arxii CBS 175.79]|uniref:Molybdopterin binding oxidoreductase n=1 Tax=Aaosphaeria arxii CBS 175.79 TaxID=1450172 RepID=A0A6A5XH82_9PLEO|nr:molybdopterin binding oxidoreductase [Aaosphaeria arxii CBS 175.79]KAF2012568.1 molybdopterin binding oxidoreductase [Aaosphaeria arxii CBS 175.79]
MTSSFPQASSPTDKPLSTTNAEAHSPTDKPHSTTNADIPTQPIRAPKPHQQLSYLTHDLTLFEENHTTWPDTDPSDWELTVDGLVRNRFTLSFAELVNLPTSSVTTFHECYGSPLHPPTRNLWKVGNVVWTGVRLSRILALADVAPEARFLWSEGRDHGVFAGHRVDSYQKDLPLGKALQDEVIVAYRMNDAPIRSRRGGPVRLVVPGWFGTNSTKWLCRLTLQSSRAPGIFASYFYNREDEKSVTGMSPVWAVEPNSMIVRPAPGECLDSTDVTVSGWAWGEVEIDVVEVCLDEGDVWVPAKTESRKDFGWQRFSVLVHTSYGKHSISARATSKAGERQPGDRTRNQVHTVQFEVTEAGSAASLIHG